jgi:Uma2 family endonuclease
MGETIRDPVDPATTAEPTWEIARLFPDQGTWSEEEYLALGGNRLVEFSHGIVEVLTMPTMAHQLIVLFLSDTLRAFVAAHGLGTVLIAPFRVRLWPGKFREPDVFFMRFEHEARMGNEFWDGADLVMEVVSDDDRRRDLEIKRREYAKAGIPEYWIVDPLLGRIIVLRLDGASYAVHGEFARGERATSSVLPGFAVDVTEALAPSARFG